MTTEEWNEAMNHLAPDIIEAYVEENNKRKEQRRLKTVRLRICAAAACFALLVGAVLVPFLQKDLNDQPSLIPAWEDALFSAEEIADLFGNNLWQDGSTSSYETVYASDDNDLNIRDLGTEEYFDIYQYNDLKPELDEQEFRAWVGGIYSRLAASMGEETPEYIIHYGYDDSIWAVEGYVGNGHHNVLKHTTIGKCFVSPSENFDSRIVNVNVLADIPSTSIDDRAIFLDGERIAVDRRMSDDEMLESLESIKNKLFTIFGVDYPDAMIQRTTRLHKTVYYYDKSVHPLAEFGSVEWFDFVSIRFDVRGNPFDKNLLTEVSIFVCDRRSDAKEQYTVIGQGKRISLEDAETLLYNGYVYANHGCALCSGWNGAVSFEGYEYVSIEYRFARDPETRKNTIGLPFYAFYKRVGTTDGGTLIYAKTYVPAIEVSGYEEYFGEKIENYHSTLPSNE